MARTVLTALPGLLICVLLAWGAVLTADLPFVKANLHFSPLLIVILFGVALGSALKLPTWSDAGVSVAQKPLLRWAVAGLGFKLSILELLNIGGQALTVVVVCTFGALAFGWWLGVRTGLNEKLSILLSVGGSVCGASAVVAADTVVQAEGEDAAVSLGVVTLWGTVGIFVFPLLGRLLGAQPFGFGVWAGSSLQEMAQVVAGAEGFDEASVKVATVVKLARICLLAPIVFYLAWWLRRVRGAAGEAKVAPVPWFLVMFVVFAAVNTFAAQIGLTKEAMKLITDGVVLLLAVGMAGVGLKTTFRDLKKAGWKPVLVGFGQWVVLSCLALVLVEVMRI
ncbi:MAG: putative sulfate exporter family transporter [Armatimonadetes bacterium]|nr:putative sulfate exporter family transporter [Armatimonadota bacterium]